MKKNALKIGRIKSSTKNSKTKNRNPMKDMTFGSPIKLILNFWGPLFIGMVFQQLYNIIDAVIVGRTLGPDALAAVGSTGAINFMIIGFCMGVCNGFAIPVAQSVGAKQESTLRKYVGNIVWLSSFFAVITTIVVCLLCSNILIWMDTPSDLFQGAYAYIFVIFLGIPVVYLYNILSGIIRSFGDSRTPLYFLVISSVLNIALDYIFILAFHMGVSGAGLATVISQAIAGTLCLLFILKRYSILRLSKDDMKPNLLFMKRLCIMGIPMGLQYSITAIGSVILQTSVNSLGATAVASVTAGSKISALFCCPFDAMGSTMATYSGQNRGAGKFDRITKGMTACSMIALCYSVIASAVLIIFGGKLSLLFVNAQEVEIIKNAAIFLKWASIFYFPLALVNIIRFTIQGLGFGPLAIFAGIFEMIARGAFGFVLVPRFGFIAACFASPVAWIMADMFLIPAYFYVIRKLKRESINTTNLIV